jgi:uncharacterized protein
LVDRLTRTLTRAGLVVALVIGAACSSDPSDATTATTAAPTTIAAPATTAAPTTTGVQPVGFTTTAATVTAADGEVCEVCLWVAATAEQRSRGLMGVTDLGGADGMAFVYDAPSTGQFWMRNTPTPLSIAFYAADGTFVSAADMEPCLTGPDAECARYAAAGPYTTAIEVPAGNLDELLMAPGSTLALLNTSCP